MPPAESASAPTPVGATRMTTPTRPTTMPASDEPRRPLAEDDPAEHGDPERHQRDEQGRDAGRDGLLAEGDHAHPAAEEQRTDDERVAELDPA